MGEEKKGSANRGKLNMFPAPKEMDYISAGRISRPHHIITAQFYEKCNVQASK